MSTPLLDRLMSKVEKTTGCWKWTASRNPSGYGQISVGGRPRGAHRVAYELLVGPVPSGLQLDHLCRNRACVNPAHLEPVTNRENTMRGDAPRLARERGEARTHCVQGHPFAGENLAVAADGTRSCRACSRVRSRRQSGERPTRRARGPMRLVTDRNGRNVHLECGHVVYRDSGHRFVRAQCGQCEYADSPECVA